MNQQLQTIDNKTGQAVTENFRSEFKRMEGEVSAALPPHIPAERFMRVVLTAVNMTPELLKADRTSLMGSCMKAAQDGLLPDGRDGALVIFKTKQKVNGRDEWIEKVQWMPMIGGILKKVRNSGDLLTIAAYVVYKEDKFYYRLGDDEKIEHEPKLDGDAGIPRLVYAIAKTKDGGIYREVMTIAQVEKVRAVSKAGKSEYGPWAQWWDEMAKKTVLKRLAKRLPTSADLDDLLRRDDDLYDFKGNRDKEDQPSTFVPVANPLKDQPALEDKTDVEQQQNPDDRFRGNERDFNVADFVISRSGKILKDSGETPIQTIIDQRYQDDDIFKDLAEWLSVCAENNLPTELGQEWKPTQPSRKVAGSEDDAQRTQGGEPDGEGSPEKPADATSAGAATERPAAETNAPRKAAANPAPARKIFEGEDDYVGYMQDVFDRATSKTAINEAWSATRADRRELLSLEQTAALEGERDAALKRFAAKG